MTSNNPSAIWIKNPLAVYAENAEAGIVIQGEKILELVPQGQSPKLMKFMMRVIVFYFLDLSIRIITSIRHSLGLTLKH
jgi:hypothetical protein